MSRFNRIESPYHFTRDQSGGWHITFGPSAVLVAHGSAWSIASGVKLYRQMQDDWHKRRKARQPMKKG